MKHCERCGAESKTTVRYRIGGEERRVCGRCMQGMAGRRGGALYRPEEQGEQLEMFERASYVRRREGV